MWAVATDNAQDFAALKNLFSKYANLKERQTSTGEKVYESEKPAEIPHLFMVGQDAQSTRLQCNWVHKFLTPKTIVSTGLSDNLNPKIQNTVDEEHAIVVPDLCIRPAGRADLAGGTLLYEEFYFDLEIQKHFLDKLRAQHPANEPIKIFSTTKGELKAQEKEWVWHHLACHLWDHNTADLCLSGKRLGMNMACFKVLREAPKSRDLFLGSWLKILPLT